jgi:hypothetical protein
MLLGLGSRFHDLARTPDAPFANRPCLPIEGRDIEGLPATIYISAEDALPVGFRLVDAMAPDPTDVLIDVGDWQTVGAIQLPRRATFTSAGEVWRYVFSQVETNPRDLGPLAPLD